MPMRRVKLPLLFCVVCLSCLLHTTRAEAIPVFFSWGGETIDKVADLPDIEPFQRDGKYLDVGVIYKQVSVFFMPVWSYEARWALFVDGSESYVEVPSEALDSVRIAAQGVMPGDPPTPFPWGLIVVGLLVAAVAVAAMGNEAQEEAEDALTADGGLLDALVTLFLFSATADQEVDDAVMDVVDEKVRKHSPTTDAEVLGEILKLSLANYSNIVEMSSERRMAFFTTKLQVVRAQCSPEENESIHQDVHDLVAADGLVTDKEQEWLDLVRSTLAISDAGDPAGAGDASSET